MKQCSKCLIEKELFSFSVNKKGYLGRHSVCNLCRKQGIKKWVSLNKDKTRLYCNEWRKRNLSFDAFRTSLYRARKKKQSPIWADTSKIKEFYLNCPKGFHVDHIIPLKGLKASGLHIETNLQYLPAKENLSKRNLFGWDSL